MNRHESVSSDQRTVTPAELPGGRDEGPMVVLAGAIAAARRRLLALALWLIFCLAAAAWYLHVTPPSYTASATVILDPKRTAPQMGDNAVLPPMLDAAAAESQMEVIRSERLLYFVFESLDLANSPSLHPDPPGLKSRIIEAIASVFRKPGLKGDGGRRGEAFAFDAFTGRVGVRRIGQSYVIEVSYTSADPDDARRLANALVSGYLGQQVSFKLAAAQNGAEYLQGRVNSLSNEVKAATAGMLAGTVPATLLPDADARVIGAALEPLGRSSPKSGLVVVFAAAFGLLSGFFVVAVLNGLDRRVRSADQLERLTGLPCLGQIPDVRRRKSLVRRNLADMACLSRREPGGRFAAAIRDTRTSLLLAVAGQRGHTLGITSWTSQAGCSLVAANLAEVVAMSGVHVTLVDGNIGSAEGGLTGLVEPVEVSLAEGLLDPTGTTSPESILFGNVSLVPARSAAGPCGFNAYLGAPGLPRLLKIWRTRGDVIVDLPALAAGGDARAAAAVLDGVVLLVELGRTTTDDVQRAVGTLSRAGGNVVGTVLNRAGV